MPDETTFELASIQFGAEPVAAFRFGYERFELRARLGPGNLEHAIAAAAEVAASVFARWSHEALAFAQRFAPARTEGQCITRRVTTECARRSRPSGAFWPWSSFRTDSRRSTLAAGTGFYAPKRTSIPA